MIMLGLLFKTKKVPLTPNFTAQQSSTDYTVVTVNDTSTGSDVLVTQRRVYFTLANAAYLTTSAANSAGYFPWAYAATSLTVNDLLDKDYALNILVQWLNVSNTVLYSKTIIYGFDSYEEAFLAQLTCAQSSSNPALINNQNYWLNKITLRTQVDDAAQAIEQGNNILAAQAAYNRGTYIVAHPQLFF